MSTHKGQSLGAERGCAAEGMRVGDEYRLCCREKLKDMYTGFCKDYPIVTIEDPFDQDDWDATAAFTAEGVCQVPHP